MMRLGPRLLVSSNSPLRCSQMFSPRRAPQSEHVVLLHFHLKHAVMVGKKKVRAVGLAGCQTNKVHVPGSASTTALM